jgi:hypothetical protein
VLARQGAEKVASFSFKKHKWCSQKSAACNYKGK